MVMEWPGVNYCIRTIVVRDGDCLMLLGQHRNCWLKNYFVGDETTHIRLRLLKPGEPLENSDS